MGRCTASPYLQPFTLHYRQVSPPLGGFRPQPRGPEPHPQRGAPPSARSPAPGLLGRVGVWGLREFREKGQAPQGHLGTPRDPSSFQGGFAGHRLFLRWDLLVSSGIKESFPEAILGTGTRQGGGGSGEPWRPPLRGGGPPPVGPRAQGRAAPPPRTGHLGGSQEMSVGCVRGCCLRLPLSRRWPPAHLSTPARSGLGPHPSLAGSPHPSALPPAPQAAQAVRVWCLWTRASCSPILSLPLPLADAVKPPGIQSERGPCAPTFLVAGAPWALEKTYVGSAGLEGAGHCAPQ